MKKIGVLLIFSLLVVSPMAFAFSFSDFFNDLFGFGNSITGAAIAKKCDDGHPCEGDFGCTNKDKKGIGICTELVSLGKACDDNHLCAKLLECTGKDKKGLGKCTEIKKSPKAVCGDGKFQVGEKCDDGNNKEGDGCSKGCDIIGVGFNCNSKALEKSVCTSKCGDGIKANDEECDDGLANTNTPCVPSYDDTCNYCTTKCVSETVNGGFCGDGSCHAKETCFACEADCDECGVYDDKPLISLVGNLAQEAGEVDISATVTYGNQCWLSVDLINIDLDSTRRERSEGIFNVVSNHPISCGNAEIDSEDRLNLLQNGKYQFFLSSLNNIPNATSKSLVIDITGSDLVISVLESDEFYDSDANPPLVSVGSTKDGPCNWVVDHDASTSEIEGGTALPYTCSNGLTNVDLSSASGPGLNVFKVTSGDLTVQKEYSYIGSDEIGALGILRSISASGAGHEVGGAYEIIFGVSGKESVIDTTGAQQLLAAMKYNLANTHKVSLADRSNLIKLYTNNEKVSDQLRAAASAFDGVTELQIAALRSVTLDARKLTKDYQILVDDFSSKESQEGWITSVDEHTLQLIFKKPGEKTIQVKINRQEKAR